MSDHSLDLAYLLYLCGMGGAIVTFMAVSNRRYVRSIFERQFRTQYKTALGDAVESFSPPSVGDLGALVRLYRDQVKEAWIDGRGEIREVEPLATEPLNVYYGLGKYERSDVIAAIAKLASKYAADAYALSSNTLEVHRDTVLSTMFFKMIRPEN